VLAFGPHTDGHTETTMNPKIEFPKGKLPLEFLQQLLTRYGGTHDRLVMGPRIGEDVAVIDMSDRYLIVKTDPITFATDQIGWYAVHVNANDVATSGATPLWMLATLLLPEKGSTPELVEGIFSQLSEACAQLGITLVGGHTEVTWGLDRPIIIGVLIGEVAKDSLLTTSNAQVGDHILLVKGIPIEATAIIARERGKELCQRGYAPELIRRAQDFLYDPGISVVKAARIAATQPGVHAMHDPTEGGLITGLIELALAAGLGLRIYREKILILPEGLTLCNAYGIDPLGAIASGALIIAVDPRHAASLTATFHEKGIPCAYIGELVPKTKGMVMVSEGQDMPLPRFAADEITRIF